MVHPLLRLMFFAFRAPHIVNGNNTVRVTKIRTGLSVDRRFSHDKRSLHERATQGTASKASASRDTYVLVRVSQSRLFMSVKRSVYKVYHSDIHYTPSILRHSVRFSLVPIRSARRQHTKVRGDLSGQR